jgi:hypothetical protein
MTIKLIRLLQLFTYLLVTSQAAFYLIVFGEALKLSSIENFLEHRRAVENLVAERYRLIYYGCLVCSMITLAIAAKRPNSPFFISSAVAFIFLLADVTIALKLNIPLNHLINTSGKGVSGAPWETVRTQWLEYFRYRGVFSCLGMISLLVGLVFDNKA